MTIYVFRKNVFVYRLNKMIFLFNYREVITPNGRLGGLKLVFRDSGETLSGPFYLLNDGHSEIPVKCTFAGRSAMQPTGFFARRSNKPYIPGVFSCGENAAHHPGVFLNIMEIYGILSHTFAKQFISISRKIYR